VHVLHSYKMRCIPELGNLGVAPVAPGGHHYRHGHRQGQRGLFGGDRSLRTPLGDVGRCEGKKEREKKLTSSSIQASAGTRGATAAKATTGAAGRGGGACNERARNAAAGMELS
jgi:hypothetical protein